jgi:hypothetical protein
MKHVCMCMYMYMYMYNQTDNKQISKQTINKSVNRSVRMRRTRLHAQEVEGGRERDRRGKETAHALTLPQKRCSRGCVKTASAARYMPCGPVWCGRQNERGQGCKYMCQVPETRPPLPLPPGTCPVVQCGMCAYRCVVRPQDRQNERGKACSDVDTYVCTHTHTQPRMCICERVSRGSRLRACASTCGSSA